MSFPILPPPTVSIVSASAFAASQGATSASLPVDSTVLQQVGAQSTLADALNIVANQAQLQFVLEGAPARLPADKPSIAKIIEDLIAQKKPVTARQLTLALADDYGYAVTEKGDTWLLSKRYENPDDFPELTIPEIQYFLKSVVQIVHSFNPEIPRENGIDTQLHDFAATMPSDMLARMKELAPPPVPSDTRQLADLPGIGHLFSRSPTLPDNADGTPAKPIPYKPGGLPVAALSPGQQQFFRSLALKEFVGKDFDRIGQILAMLREEDSPQTRFFPKQYGPRTKLTSERIAHGNQYRVALAPVSRGFLHLDNDEISSSYVPLLYGDPDAPKPSDYGPDKKPLPWNESGRFTRTLGALANSVSENSPVVLYVAPELAEKKVTLIDGRQGAKNDAKAMVQTIAQLYNVTPRASKDGKEITLGLPTRPTVTRLEQIAKAVEAMMPAPIKHLCEDGWRANGFAERGKRLIAAFGKTEDGNPKFDVTVARNTAVEIQYGRDAMRRQAMRALSVRLEPMIAINSDHIVMWDELDAESKWLMQFILCMEAFPYAYSYTQNGMPSYLAQFDKDRAYAEVYQDEGRTWLRVKLLNENRTEGVTRQGVISKP